MAKLEGRVTMRHTDSRNVFLLILCATLAVTACGSDDGAGTSKGPLETLGLDEATARQYTMDALTNGYLWVGAAGARFKALSDDGRSSVVTEGMSWARTFVESDAFKSAYEELRKSRMPTAPEFEGSVDDELEQTREKQLAEVEETRNTTLPMLPPESRQQMEQGLAQTTEYFNNPEMLKALRATIEQTRVSSLASYESALDSWNTDYPEDPNALVARRLQHFLDVTTDVNFDAGLVERDGAMKFENEEYETKSAEWKMAFRAGEDAVTAGRETATEWLADL
jgi:hypothetical protein